MRVRVLLGILGLLAAAEVSGSNLSRTGQTTTYAPQDDGDLQTGLPWPTPRLQIHGDGTVTDNLSGLMWLADLNCPATLGLDPDGAVPWADAFTLRDAVNAGGECAGLSASYGDWRIPNVNEMDTLNDFETFTPAWLSGVGFVNVPTNPATTFWTGTPAPGGCERFYTSGLFNDLATGSKRVALVRGAISGEALIAKTGVTASCREGDDGDLELGRPWPVPRFVDEGDGTVTDRLTNLMWMKDANCIRLAGLDADGFVTWAEALGFAVSVNGGASLSACAGYSALHTDWRLPNIRELRSLLDYSRSAPGLPTGHPFTTVQGSLNSARYWSNTTWGRDTGQALLTWFGIPSVGSQGKGAAFDHVWLVRDAPDATGGCTPSDTALCLSGGRFRVETTWRTTQGTTGTGHAVALTPDTGYFWFFASSNVEMVVKVLDACPLNSRFWVFAGGLTDVRVEMTVTDTENGSSKTYTNLLGTPFAPIQDTAAIATCP